ncbi:Clr5 domain-containing protein [Xylaria arbuscula]|nr:Clr5 domain-containing protein [Xylaria arbuscula]
MQAANTLQQTQRAIAHRTHTTTKLLYLPCLDIPVQVVARKIGLPKQHSQEEWDRMKPTIHKLYIDEQLPLESVMCIMAEQYGFAATNKMYKIRFTRWGWRKNRTRDEQHPDPCPSQRMEGPATAYRIESLRAPDFFSDHENLISISRNLTMNISEVQCWCISFDLSKSTIPSFEQSSSVSRFMEAETAFSNTIIRLKSGQINDAFRSLNRIFDAMTGNELYLYPKHPTTLWLLCDVIYDACVLVKDSTFRLLHELLFFLAQNSLSCFKQSATTSSNDRVKLLTSLTRVSQSNPNVMKQVFRTACLVTAESLEEKLGKNHPIVLTAWFDYFWYFGLPVDPAMNIVVRSQAVLSKVEAALGRQADATIILLQNNVTFLFYCIGDEIQARQSLSDLMERIAHRIAVQEPGTTSYGRHFQKAYAFGSLLQGLLILEDHNDIGRCEKLIRVTIEWLKHSGGSGAAMHARMLEMDLSILINAWKDGKNLRDLTLVYAKPRLDKKPKRERESSGRVILETLE